MSANDKAIPSSMDVAAPSSTTHHSTAANSAMVPTEYAKPTLTYVCLVAMAMKNSCTGSLLINEICSFLTKHFPYFRTATNDWKRSVRNVLSTNKCFTKTESLLPVDDVRRNDARLKKLWTMDPTKMATIEEDIYKWLGNVRSTMAVPENLPALLRGEMTHGRRIDTYTEADEIIHTESEMESNDSITSRAESAQFDCTDEQSAVFEEVNNVGHYSYPEAHAFMPNTEHSPAAPLECDLQPIAKRPRHDITSPVTLQSTSAAAASITSKPQSTKFNETASKFSRPAFSYTCLIAMALRNSWTGSLSTPEIYGFLREHFPYFKAASDDWKDRIRNSLSKNQYFKKLAHRTIDGVTTKKCLWTIKPSKLSEVNAKLELESGNNQTIIQNAMPIPGNFPALLRGEIKHGSLSNNSVNSNDVCIDDSEFENWAIESIIDSEENIRADYFDDVPDMFDEIDIEDLLPCQNIPCSENGQSEMNDSDLQPVGKRARFDIG